MVDAFPDADLLCLWSNVPDRYAGRELRETWLTRTPMLRAKERLQLRLGECRRLLNHIQAIAVHTPPVPTTPGTILAARRSIRPGSRALLIEKRGMWIRSREVPNSRLGACVW